MILLDFFIGRTRIKMFNREHTDVATETSYKSVQILSNNLFMSEYSRVININIIIIIIVINKYLKL